MMNELDVASSPPDKKLPVTNGLTVRPCIEDDTDSSPDKKVSNKRKECIDGLTSTPKIQKKTDVPLCIKEKRSELQHKKEILRKLKMVKKYRSINNLDDLTKLTLKWRTACQDSLQDLQKMLNTEQTNHSIDEILNGLGIDFKTVQYDAESENFY